MGDFYAWEDDEPPNLGDLFGTTHPRDTTIQIIFSAVLGIGAFLAFCTLRPRWTGLYAARKKSQDNGSSLPELPNSFFGWIVPLWKINDQQILASAGLDAYVFLAFFKMAIKFLFLTFLFSLIVIKPVHDAFPEEPANNGTDPDKGGKHHNGTKGQHTVHGHSIYLLGNGTHNGTNPSFDYRKYFETEWLWMYVVFAYLFSGIAMYLIISETRRIIEVRQEYLGTQTTITDRTIRLSGIPRYMQDETKIKEFMESLDIGGVERVTLCRNWKELDQAMDKRMDIVRRLEEAYTVHLGYRRIGAKRSALPVAQPDLSEPLINHEDEAAGESAEPAVPRRSIPVRQFVQARPKAIVRYGFLNLRMRRVDAIDHYETQLREIDARILQLRENYFEPTSLAFVTMDSVATCQMTIQAVLDPSPLQLIANQSPTPSDVIWPNTYMSRRGRMFRAWSVTLIIGVLTIFWVFILIPIAGLLNLEAIRKVLPQLADALEAHENIQSLIKTQLPTLITSLLMVLVPYLYYALSWCQGEISKGDIELSSISKNFFFTFFNFFVVFMVLGTASNFLTISQFFKKFGELGDFERTARTLALSLQQLLSFYVNFIILQGVGLFPFRLLEMGSVSLYPIYLMGAKTPRDYAELVQPPIFSYGFYLPSALLIFIICMVYSVLRQSWQVLLAGLLYFSLGHFVYKYQLLYAMDHRQQATGRAWGMICDRIFMGLIFFQLTTTAQLAFKSVLARSVLMLPLIVATVWMSIVFGKTYKPLLKFIALSSVRRGEQYSDSPPGEIASMTNSAILERNVWADAEYSRARANVESRVRRGFHDTTDTESRFVNPSLVVPLKGVWIADKVFGSGGIGIQSPPVIEEEAEEVADGAENV